MKKSKSAEKKVSQTRYENRTDLILKTISYCIFNKNNKRVVFIIKQLYPKCKPKPEIFIFDPNFDLWAKFLFLTKTSARTFERY